MDKSPYSTVKSAIANAVNDAISALGYGEIKAESTIDFSRAFGDISSSVSFEIARKMGKAPDSVASSIAEKIKRPSNIEKIEVKNGFINFYLERGSFAKMLFRERDIGEKTKRGKAIIEYISVNPNKPWHIGHLRNALLGDSISNIYGYLGYEIERENYIDDLGLQMAETLWWYMNKNGKPDKKFDHWLGEEYVKVNEHLNDPDAKAGIPITLSAMAQHGTYESKILREIVTECIKAQYQTAFSFSLYQNLLVWESDIVRERFLEKALELLKGYGFVKKPKDGDYANCIIIDLKEIDNLPEEFRSLKESAKVLVRSDGTPTYIAKDIAFHMWKFGIIPNTFKYSKFIGQENGKPLYTTSQEGQAMDFSNADVAINVIDLRQSHPQSIIRLVFDSMGKSKEANSIEHLPYGMVVLESGALSGRKGTWLGYSADDLLREAKAKADALIGSRFTLGKEEQEKIAASVAVAAIKFEFLRISPEKRLVFSWDKALNFEGNSGPYAQYMHARSTRIIGDAPKEYLNRKVSEIPKLSDNEFHLVKLLSRELDVVEKAMNELRPNVVTEYIGELASSFASFYEQSPILKAKSDEEKGFRIQLALSFKKTIKSMLELLGIEALERM